MTTHGPFGFATATTDGSDEFLWSNTQPGPPSQDADTLPATSGNLQWWWIDGPTGSGGIGPDTGQGGDPEGYVFPECSDTGTGFDDTYDMEFDTTLDAAAEQWQFNFWTNQRGTDNGMLCEVQINESGGGWVTVTGGTFGGLGDPDRVDTDGTPIWISRSVDLSDSGANADASTRVRILLTMPSVGTTWHNDYGIDTIEIVGTPLGAEYTQEGHQFRLDDDDEVNATDLGAQDSNITAAKQINRRLRVLVDTDGDAPSEGVTLEYRKVGDAASEWRPVPLDS